MRVLSGVVYRLNKIGPRTEPWGTPHVREDERERGAVGWRRQMCETISMK